MRRVLATLVFAALAGCASSGMEESECLTADWRAIGYEDGARGLGPQHFGVRRKACAEHGVAAGFDAYMAGREEGLAHYCRPRNGWRMGVAGRAYEGVCPPAAEAAFLAAHADGYGLYERRVALRDVADRLNDSRARARELEFVLADRAGLVASPGLTAADRAALIVEIKQLTEEKLELERAIPLLEEDYAAARYEYDDYRARVAPRYSG